MIVLLVMIMALVGPQTNALSVRESLHRPVVKRDNTIVDNGADGGLPRQLYLLADANPDNEKDHLSVNSNPKVIVKGIRRLGSGGWDIDRRRRRNAVGGLDNTDNEKENLSVNPNPKVVVKGIRTLGSGGWDIDRRRRRNVV